MRVVVISDQSQLDRFLKEGYRPENFEVYCDNPTFSSELTKRQIQSTELNQFVIQDQWDKVNAWGCGAAAAWVKSARSNPKQTNYDFPSILYLHFSHNLVHLIKNYLYARWLIDTIKPETVIVFDDKPKKVFPDFSGNYFLNHNLWLLAIQKNIPTIKLPESLTTATRTDLDVFSRPNNMRDFLRALSQNINALFYSSKKARGIWVCGSLRHLGPVLLKFKIQKIPFFLYDRNFNFGQFFFALRNRIPYVTPSTKAKSLEPASERFAAENFPGILKSFDETSKTGAFVFDGYDFAPFIRNHIVRGLTQFLQEWAGSEAEYKAVLSNFRVKALLTDEDYARRGGFLCAFLKKYTIPVFCISHSATAVEFEVSKELCCIGQSTTFVNSDFEKDAYVARGWDPKALVKTGIPRYDSLIKQPQMRHRKQDDPLRLLFCTSAFVSYSDNPDRHGYLGLILSVLTENVKTTVDLFCKTVKETPGTEAILKPYGVKYLNAWDALVAANGVQDRVKVVRSHSGIDRFFATSDAMVLSYWSTAMIEAAIHGLPIIFMDLKKFNRRSVEKFAKAGFCEIVHDEHELREAIIRLRSNRTPPCRNADKALASYFLGEGHGNATARVADFIQEQLFAKPAGRHV